MSDRIADAAAIQRLALNPRDSVWVAASAGTGKTKVLTDRLLALMLDGTDPAHILCLTFTRAAAAEMANRINARLAAWTTMPGGKLSQELVELTGRYPDEDDTARARQLFARVLDVPGGTKIATIHAFCQSLLRRFPLEAGVPPEFTVIDERSAGEALAEAAEQVIASARDGSRPALAAALAVVARYAAEDSFIQLMTALASERGKLAEAMKAGQAALHRQLCAKTGVPEDATGDSVIADFCAEGAGDEARLRMAVAALLEGAPTDRERGVRMARWLEHPGERESLLDDYLGAFLTEQGALRARLITKGAAGKVAPADPAAVMQVEGQRILCFQEQRAGVALVEATVALVCLGEALMRAYERRKRLQGLLDYDDLVLKALELLRRPGVAPWVLFKLDGGLDHILIDEAQDTNPEQWEIVAALAEEFFAGDGTTADRDRTVFAVGDAKQSIYSFQRADPAAFARMREHFQGKVVAAKQQWTVVPLEISFRSTEPVLQAVDAVFQQVEAANGVALDATPIRHIASREGHAGHVELWPPVLPDPEEDPDPAAPVTPRRRRAEPRTRLARAIAATIANWLATGERLDSRGRPLRPGDIMVLVRRRNEFVGDLLRALKQKDVPVAGADRLVLTEQLAVQDLVALGRFLLLPEDDLNLATVLKGPLFGLTEDELYLLAYNRGRDKLWTRLQRKAPESLTMNAAAKRLRELLARADFVPPFELYAEILGGGGGRRAMLERLGPEAADPIDEFLAHALAYEREHVPSLQGFLRWLVAGEIEVKRDFAERQRDEVRILTVHGAKGLEAPVVFMPDTLQLPDNKAPLLWSDAEALPLWCPRKTMAAPFYLGERRAWRQRQLQEYRRLLYVALTRAQDRLYLCGWETQRPAHEPTWHSLCLNGWQGIAEPMPFDTRPLIGERDGWTGDGLRLAGAQTADPSRDHFVSARPYVAPLPSWALSPPPPEPTPPKPLLPSRPSGPEPATLSPLAAAGRDRFKRGLLVHRLLQSLPELPEAEREEAAQRFLALPTHGLGPAEQAELCAETLAVLRAPGFAELWGPNAQAEVPVVGLIGAHALSGQIDRLVVTKDRVLIVDFKTIRPSPDTEDDVPEPYLRQLATYQAALGRIYPGRRVDCALLWTDGPRLMPVSATLLQQHLPGPLLV